MARADGTDVLFGEGVSLSHIFNGEKRAAKIAAGLLFFRLARR